MTPPIPGARVRRVSLEVVAVIVDGTSVGVAYACDASGMHAAVAVEPRMARLMRDDLAAGHRPLIEVEPWQLLPGFPWPSWLE